MATQLRLKSATSVLGCSPARPRRSAPARSTKTFARSARGSTANSPVVCLAAGPGSNVTEAREWIDNWKNKSDAGLPDGARVLVTGAGGRTGQLVLKKLAESGVSVRGMVRTDKSKKRVQKLVSGAEVDIVVGDVSSAEDVKAAVEGCTHLVVLSSAKPQIKKRSLVRIMVKKLLRMDPGRPTFRWIENGEPEVVDFTGGCLQIDAAKAAGLDQVVWVGSMGGTQSDNFLNTIGDGKILLWKRKAEEYLIESGVPYTIIHPGGLLNKDEGKRELVIDVDDKILESDQRSIPRGDVASVVVGCLGLQAACNRAFDLASKGEEIESGVETDVSALLGSLNGASCDYELNAADVLALEHSVSSPWSPSPKASEPEPEPTAAGTELRWVGETSSTPAPAVAAEAERSPEDAWYSW